MAVTTDAHVEAHPPHGSLMSIGAVLHDPGFERDGRRPQAWRDKLEDIIAGDWLWDENETAGVKRGDLGAVVGSGTAQRTIYNVGKNRKASKNSIKEDPGVGLTQGITVSDQHLSLDNEIPETRTVAHVPGKLTIHHGYVYLGGLTQNDRIYYP